MYREKRWVRLFPSLEVVPHGKYFHYLSALLYSRQRLSCSKAMQLRESMHDVSGVLTMAATAKASASSTLCARNFVFVFLRC